jgi:S1-C subfamily serine protease
MLKYLYSALLAVVIVLVMGVVAATFTVHQVDLGHSTVGVWSYAGTGHGKGVYIGSGAIITAAHVAKPIGDDGNGHVKIIKDDGKSLNATVTWYNEVTDVALLTLDGASDLPAADLACNLPDVTVGEELLSIGNPLDLSNIHTYGRVAGKVDMRDGKVTFIADVTIGPGNSGGPMFTRDGKVAGITRATSIAPLVTNRGFFVSIVAFTYVIPRSIICHELSITHPTPQFGTPAASIEGQP